MTAAPGTLAVTAVTRFSMDEDAFRRFYDVTVHPLRAYLTRLAGSAALADDLAQEAYCRLLQARVPSDEDGRRRYLFRIGTNLCHDHWRRARRDGERTDPVLEPVDEGAEHRLQVSSDVGTVFRTLKPRQRALLWLAYVEGMRHREIAEVLGVTRLSVRPLLARARREMAKRLRARGLGPVDSWSTGTRLRS